MSGTMATISGMAFALITLFVVWLKYHEHLHLHRHEHGPHTNRTDLRQLLYRLSDSGALRRRPPDKRQ